MKVYIVTKGYYFDYHIDAVFTSLRKAELYVAVRKNNKYSDEYDIEEFDTADEKVTDKNEKVGYLFRAMWAPHEGWFVPEYLDGELQFEPNPEKLTWNTVWISENNPTKARKILQDRITQHNAINEALY